MPSSGGQGDYWFEYGGFGGCAEEGRKLESREVDRVYVTGVLKERTFAHKAVELS